MAASKLVAFLLLFALILFNSLKIRADAVSIEGGGYESVEVVGSDGSDSSALKIELETLVSKIQTLESRVEEKIKELKSKDEIVAQKDKMIKEKSDKIASLQTNLTTLKTKGNVNVEEQVGMALAQADELEKQVEKLEMEIEAQKREKEATKVRATEAEKKVDVLNSYLENIRKTNDEQKTKFQKTEHTLKVVQEEMMKAKLEATSKAQELTEVHGAWLPRWLAVHLMQCQSFMEMHWNQCGKPAMELVIREASLKKAAAKQWAEPHVETLKNKLIPAMKEKWLVITTYIEPHVQSLSSKTREVYVASKTTITPHVIKIQEVVDPYFQEARTFSKPYIDQVATATKPHVDKVRLALKPYTKKLLHAYARFLKIATQYHSQVQGTVRDTLKKHELTKPLATKELEWFVASALLALPFIILSRTCSAYFCKKARKPVRNVHTSHTRRKAKRGHPDK